MARQYSRRQVVKRSAAGAAGLALAPMAGPLLGANGANERIRLAVAGLRGRGGSHVGAFAGMEGVEVVYVVDPDKREWEKRITQAQESSGGHSKPTGVQDIREVLDDKRIDAITIATPNHWHSLMTIWACQAGKHVYVEKPLSHNVHEGRVAVEAARRYGRIVQHGTQRRSDHGWAKVMAAIHSGELGKLHVARGLCYKDRPSIGYKPHTEPPAELDFNLWQGPARDLQYHENLVHYNWHWFWATGNGDIGNQGVHQMDVAMWGIRGDQRLPKSAISLGGRFAYKDQGETANTQISVMDYGDTQLIFEVRRHRKHPYKGVTVGNVFHLDAGTIVEKKFYPTGSDKEAPLPEMEYSRGPGGNHYANFIAAVRSDDKKDLNATVEDGHYSSALCHLSNLSYRVGRMGTFGEGAEALGNNQPAQEAFERMQEHLRQDGMEPKKMALHIGDRLEVDTQNETVVNNPLAGMLLFRDYREGFEVPAEIV